MVIQKVLWSVSFFKASYVTIKKLEKLLFRLIFCLCGQTGVGLFKKKWVNTPNESQNELTSVRFLNLHIKNGKSKRQ